MKAHLILAVLWAIGIPVYMFLGLPAWFYPTSLLVAGTLLTLWQGIMKAAGKTEEDDALYALEPTPKPLLEELKLPILGAVALILVATIFSLP